MIPCMGNIHGVGKLSNSFDGAILKLTGLTARKAFAHLLNSEVTQRRPTPILKRDSISRD